MSNITNLPSTSNPNYLKVAQTIIAKSAIQRAKADPVLLNFLKNDQMFARATTDRQAYMRNDVVSVPLAPKPIATISTNINDDVVYQTNSIDTVNLTLDCIANTAYSYRSIQNMVTSVDLATTYGEACGISLVEAMLEDLHDKNLNNEYATAGQTIGSSTLQYNDLLLRRIRTVFEVDFNVKIRETLVMFVRPEQYEVLTGIERFSEADKIGDGSTILTGVRDRLYNIEIYSDRNLPSYTTGSLSSINGFPGYVMTKTAAVLSVRPMEIIDPLYETVVNIDGLSIFSRFETSGAKVGGSRADVKFEILYGHQAIPSEVNNSGVRIVPIYRVLGGVAS